MNGFSGEEIHAPQKNTLMLKVNKTFLYTASYTAMYIFIELLLLTEGYSKRIPNSARRKKVRQVRHKGISAE